MGADRLTGSARRHMAHLAGRPATGCVARLGAAAAGGGTLLTVTLGPGLFLPPLALLLQPPEDARAESPLNLGLHRVVPAAYLLDEVALRDAGRQLGDFVLDATSLAQQLDVLLVAGRVRQGRVFLQLELPGGD